MKTFLWLRIARTSVCSLAALLTALAAPASALAADDEDDDDAAEGEQEAVFKDKGKGKGKKAAPSDDDDDDKPPAPGEDRDGARFRGAISGGGGVLAIPDADLVLGAAGVQGQIGAQITNLVGLVWVPGFDVLFGKAGGVGVHSAILVDFTIADIFSVGVGPEVGAFLAIGTEAVASGANYGGRLHLAVHPVVGDGDDGIRRKAFTIAADVRMLGGPVAAVGPTGSSVTVTGFIVQPMLTLGYTAF